jgi:deoxycytidylate deaminase
MQKDLPRIDRPELIFGFVAPIGADLNSAITKFRQYFEMRDYVVHEIQITGAFKSLEKVVVPALPLKETPKYDRFTTYIKYGNQLRAFFDDNSFLAKTAVFEIARLRNKSTETDKFRNVVYLLKQFKRKEEVDLLREVYGRQFFQVSIYSRRSARIDNLARGFAHSVNRSDINSFRDSAEAIVQLDTEEKSSKNGQSVGKIFHEADFIINSDVATPAIGDQINRFCELLFGSNSISPTKIEYGMLSARAAALRSLDLSRQVGAAIFSENGEVISLGSNEVPKAGGGTYWSDGDFDDREYKRNEDSNDRRKRELLGEIASILIPEKPLEEILANKEIQESQFMDALEYGRIIHAEMSAVIDAARLGRPLKGASMFVTTFPCHMCAKHIVAAGVDNVFFLEPYPKSLAFDLHSDSIRVEGSDRGNYEAFPSVRFEHFWGITPRRYRDMFPRGKRKNEQGDFSPYIENPPIPIIDIRLPTYIRLENVVSKILLRNLTERVGRQEDALTVPMSATHSPDTRPIS